MQRPTLQSRKRYVFDNPPNFGPPFFRKLLYHLTYNEAHAMLLGLTGLFVGVGPALGYTDLSVAFTVLAVSWSFGLNAILSRLLPWNFTWTDSPLTKIFSKDPWYFLTIYIFTTFLSASLI